MLDFAHIEKYRENNRIEAKRALGGLPESIWETYSAFANTLGGIILLGVVESGDKTFHTVDLPDPEWLIEEFTKGLNDRKKVSANILSEGDITVERIGSDRIVAIRVPRARRVDRPIYIDGNPKKGSYRRSGEGDYRCSAEEIEAMQRDAQEKTEDMRPLAERSIDDLNADTLCRYREHRDACQGRQTFGWQLEIAELLRLGALAEVDGMPKPTAAGLLMFGHYDVIKAEYPHYALTYKERGEGEEFCGNLYDFYGYVYEKLTAEQDTPVADALREALGNCLVNADYRGRGGIVVEKSESHILLANSGAFRVDAETAKGGGVSDPRNSALMELFSQVGVGKRMGGGIQGIFGVWKKRGFAPPRFEERFEPARITLTLPLGSERSLGGRKTAAHRQAVIEYLTEHASAEEAELSVLLGLDREKLSALLSEMKEAGLIASEGALYRLNS